MSSFKWTDCPVIIPYYGGKYQLSKVLVPMLPKHERYIEVFAGGLSMYFRKVNSKLSIVNDFDNDIANLYHVICEDFDRFKSYCKMIPKARHLFYNFRLELKDKPEINFPDYRRAVKYYYIIMNAFNNNYHTPMSKEDDWDTNALDFIHYGRKKLLHTVIENFDFRELHKRYPPKKGDFWYYDPPYIRAGERKDYYFYHFTEEDHIELSELVKTIDKAGAKFMVSYDDREIVMELYKGFIINKIPVKYAGQTTNRDYKNELVITNYEPNNQQVSLL
jgi:DNA adenine methylase|tara:strand:- start:17391 stop:18218 length:828 start_codon:yes stop_codon:yes gene_type:complete